MATENRGVMVYLPLELEEKVVEYCTEYKIVRKDKQGNIFPSLGSGIVAYLKSHLLGDLLSDRRGTVPGDRSISGLTRDEVLDLIAESNTSNRLSDELIEEVDGELARRVEKIERSVASSVGLGKDEVEQLIQESERRVMETVQSGLAQLRGELTAVKQIDKQVNALQESIYTNSPEMKQPKDNGQYLGIDIEPDNSLPIDRKPLSKDIRRWFQPIQEDEKFRAIIQTGIAEESSNREIVTKLFNAGYGKNENTEPYPHNLASAMKTAFQLSSIG